MSGVVDSRSIMTGIDGRLGVLFVEDLAGRFWIIFERSVPHAPQMGEERAVSTDKFAQIFAGCCLGLRTSWSSPRAPEFSARSNALFRQPSNPDGWARESPKRKAMTDRGNSGELWRRTAKIVCVADVEVGPSFESGAATRDGSSLSFK